MGEPVKIIQVCDLGRFWCYLNNETLIATNKLFIVENTRKEKGDCKLKEIKTNSKSQTNNLW